MTEGELVLYIAVCPGASEAHPIDDMSPLGEPSAPCTVVVKRLVPGSQMCVLVLPNGSPIADLQASDSIMHPRIHASFFWLRNAVWRGGKMNSRSTMGRGFLGTRDYLVAGQFAASAPRIVDLCESIVRYMTRFHRNVVTEKGAPNG